MNTKSTHTQQCELIIRNTQRHTVPTKKREWNHQSARAMKSLTRKQISTSQILFKLRNQNQFRFSNFVRWKYMVTSSSCSVSSLSVVSAWIFLLELEDAIEEFKITTRFSRNAYHHYQNPTIRSILRRDQNITTIPQICT